MAARLADRLAEGLAVAGRRLRPALHAERRRHHRQRAEGQTGPARSASHRRRGSAWPSGGIRNWPSEPSAVVMPSAAERRSGATLRPTAASTTPNAVPLSAKPSSTPALRYSSERARGLRHQPDAEGVDQAADRDRPAAAPFVGDHADERLRDAPDQVLQRHRKGEHLAPPTEILAHRLQEQPEARADAERQQHDERAADDREHRGARQPIAQGAPSSGSAPAAIRRRAGARARCCGSRSSRGRPDAPSRPAPRPRRARSPAARRRARRRARSRPRSAGRCRPTR